ncbi:MAG TPA: hypothetical protein PKB15_07820, partial [Acidimicrobiia bacterium]|nr:hypothetical protein [Acidimicrobiia bacterium]
MSASSFFRLPRKILVMYFFAFVFLIASIFVTQWHVAAQGERTDIRENGQKTTALVVSRKKIEYTTFKGKVTARPLVAPMTGTLKRYDLLTVYYDKDNPKQVVLDQDDSAYNITMWIVVAKLFGASLVIAGLAYRKQRK